MRPTAYALFHVKVLASQSQALRLSSRVGGGGGGRGRAWDRCSCLPCQQCLQCGIIFLFRYIYNSTDQYICCTRVQMYTMSSSRKAQSPAKLLTIICVVLVIIGVKQRGIRIIIRRGMVMLTSFGHPEEKKKCIHHDLSHALKKSTNQAAKNYLLTKRA